MSAIEIQEPIQSTLRRLASGDLGNLSESLADMIGLDPHRPGPARGRLIVEGIPVWALIGQLKAIVGVEDVLGDALTTEAMSAAISRVAEDYGIPPAAVLAALLYYRDHRAAIDGLLAANAAAIA